MSAEPMSAAEVLAVLALVNAASPGPWEPDDMESDGVYGDGGPDGRAGFMAQRMRDTNGVSIFDSLNSEGAMVDEDVGEDSVYAWDVVAEKNFKAIAAAVNFFRQHGAAVSAMAEREAALRAEVEALRAALRNLVGAVSSINSGKGHELTVSGERVYWQREEWVRWMLDEILPSARAAIDAARAEARDV